MWKDKAYGTTYEPVVFIYNKRLIPQGEVANSHAALSLPAEHLWIFPKV